MNTDYIAEYLFVSHTAGDFTPDDKPNVKIPYNSVVLSDELRTFKVKTDIPVGVTETLTLKERDKVACTFSMRVGKNDVLVPFLIKMVRKV